MTKLKWSIEMKATDKNGNALVFGGLYTSEVFAKEDEPHKLIKIEVEDGSLLNAIFIRESDGEHQESYTDTLVPYTAPAKPDALVAYRDGYGSVNFSIVGSQSEELRDGSHCYSRLWTIPADKLEELVEVDGD